MPTPRSVTETVRDTMKTMNLCKHGDITAMI